jgi:hypothetical protein
MYDPKIGKWISAGPIGFEGEDANLYRYVGNGATNAIDPKGLAPPIWLENREFWPDPPTPIPPAPASPLVTFDPEIYHLHSTELGPCGSAQVGFEFFVPEATIKQHLDDKRSDEKVGYILQEMTVEFDIEDCDDNHIPAKSYHYWEAWDVYGDGGIEPGEISGLAGIQHDTIQTKESGDCTRGTSTFERKLKGVLFYTLPSHFKVDETHPSNGLPYSETPPGFWQGSGFNTTHTVTIEWDCCPGNGDHTKETTIDPVNP